MASGGVRSLCRNQGGADIPRTHVNIGIGSAWTQAREAVNRLNARPRLPVIAQATAVSGTEGRVHLDQEHICVRQIGGNRVDRT